LFENDELTQYYSVQLYAQFYAQVKMKVRTKEGNTSTLLVSLQLIPHINWTYFCQDISLLGVFNQMHKQLAWKPQP